MSTPPVAQDKINAHGLDAVCNDILNGKSLRAIARSLGVDIAQRCRWKAQLHRPEVIATRGRL
jgi:hypothetical protein